MKQATSATLPTRRKLRTRQLRTKRERSTLTRPMIPVRSHLLHYKFFELIQFAEDERSIGNRLAAAEPQNDSTSGKNLSKEDKAAQDDPTAPARMHGNEPSKGAKIDKSIEDEEAEIIAKMDAKKGKK